MQTGLALLALASLALASPMPDGNTNANFDLGNQNVRVHVDQTNANGDFSSMVGCLNELVEANKAVNWHGDTTCKSNSAWRYSLNGWGGYDKASACFNICAPEVGKAQQQKQATSVACNHSAGFATCTLAIWPNGVPKPDAY